ncbi:MAG: SAVED domain-containing protein [Granulosicoccus sp.]
MRELFALVRWIFRKRPPWAILLKAGLTLIALAVGGGLALTLGVVDGDQSFDIGIVNDATPSWVTSALFVLGLGLCIIATVLCVSGWREEQRINAQQLCLVVELRGLRQMPGSPLVDAVRNTTKSACQSLPIDLRESLYDGDITHPGRALDKVLNIHQRIVEASQMRSPSDVSVMFGGLAPVPFTFLAGVLIDDERQVETWDWNRHKRHWTKLDGHDDDDRFQISGIPEANANRSVALCMSVSYEIDTELVERCIPDASIVSMRLNTRSTDNHWSEQKQQALGQQFVETVLELHEQGVEQIHLFLAAQSSVVFRLGTLYDRRNMPALLVHQFEPAGEAGYPWAVIMPVYGNGEVSIVYGSDTTSD